MNTLTEEQDKVWKRLTHVSMFPGPGISFNVNSFVGMKRVKGDAESVTIKVIKNRR